MYYVQISKKSMEEAENKNGEQPAWPDPKAQPLTSASTEASAEAHHPVSCATLIARHMNMGWYDIKIYR